MQRIIQSLLAAISCVLTSEQQESLNKAGATPRTLAWSHNKGTNRGSTVSTNPNGVSALHVDIPEALHLVIGLLLAQLNGVAHALCARILGTGTRFDRALLSGRHDYRAM